MSYDLIGRLTKVGTYFFVYYYIHLDASFGGSFEHAINAVLFVLGGRSAQVEFGREPPFRNNLVFVTNMSHGDKRTIQDPDGFTGSLQSHADSPHITTSIDVPLNIIAFSLRSEALEAMLLIPVRSVRTFGGVRVAMDLCVSVPAHPLFDVRA